MVAISFMWAHAVLTPVDHLVEFGASSATPMRGNSVVSG